MGAYDIIHTERPEIGDVQVRFPRSRLREFRIGDVVPELTGRNDQFSAISDGQMVRYYLVTTELGAIMNVQEIDLNRFDELEAVP